MRRLKTLLPVLLPLIVVAASAQTRMTSSFNKIIVSPYIQVTLVQGDQESVTVNEIHVDTGKLHIEVNDKTLRIYLEGAKEVTKNEKNSENEYEGKQPLYKGTVVTAVVSYKTLHELSIRGEETQVCKSVLTGDKFRLTVYGESQVILNEVNLGKMQTVLYGESSLEIKSGTVKDQRYTAYGEGHINTLGINGNTGSITAYGEANFRLNVSDEIKITAFGDATLQYKGNPVINKGLHFGDMHVEKLD